MAQRLPGDGLGPGRRPGLPGLPVIVAGPARQLDGQGPVGAGEGGVGGAFPQQAGRRLPGRGIWVRRAGQGQVRGRGVAGRGQRGRAGALGALGGPDQRAVMACPRISAASGSPGTASSASR